MSTVTDEDRQLKAPVRNAPGPRPGLPGSLALVFQRNPLKFFMDAAARYGDIAYFDMGFRKSFLFSHPDLVKDVLVTNDRLFQKTRGLRVAESVLGKGLLTSEGDFHLRQRRMIQPAFHRQRIAGYAGTMVDYALRTRQRWQDGETLDIHAEMMRLTLAIVGKTLFGADVEAEAGEIGLALKSAFGMFRRSLNPVGAWMERLTFLPSNRRFAAANRRLDATIFRMIDEHRERSERGEHREHREQIEQVEQVSHLAASAASDDLLSMLLRAQDEEGDGGRMTDRQVRDETMTIFLAGHETTANALTWTWYLLSQNPAAEEKLHRELDVMLGSRPPSVEDVPQLKYTEMVLTEAMRLYPPAWVVGREAQVDYPVRDYVVPAGSAIFMSQYVLHHDPRYFSNPWSFTPERWTAEFKAGLPKFAYFPFGGGPRLCIGEPFAWMEGVLLIAALAQKWRMRLAHGQRVALLPQITLRPRYGMRMVLTKRG